MRSADARCAARIAVSGFVDALDQITGLLKFDRKKISRRDVDALGVDALLVSTARSDLVIPKIPSAQIRKSAEEIKVVLTDVEPWIVNDVGRKWIQVITLRCDSRSSLLIDKNAFFDLLWSLELKISGKQDIRSFGHHERAMWSDTDAGTIPGRKRAQRIGVDDDVVADRQPGTGRHEHRQTWCINDCISIEEYVLIHRVITDSSRHIGRDVYGSHGLAERSIIAIAAVLKRVIAHNQTLNARPFVKEECVREH